MLTYAVKMDPDTNGGLLVSFPDVPGAFTSGDNIEDALKNALECLEVAIEICFDERRAVPLPSKPPKDAPTVTLPAIVAAKVFLNNEMVSRGLRKADLARLMDVHQTQVDRLLTVSHESKMSQVESAINALGKKLKIVIA